MASEAIELLASTPRALAYDGTDPSPKYGAAVDVSAKSTIRLTLPAKPRSMTCNWFLEVGIQTAPAANGPWRDLETFHLDDARDRVVVVGFDAFVRARYVLMNLNLTKAADPNSYGGTPQSLTFGLAGEAA